MRSVTAKLNYLKIAPRKARLVADSIKGLSVNEAEAQLSISPKRAALPIIKLLRSAIANAKHNQQLDAGRLFIKEIRVDQGTTLKRHIPRAMGRTTPIHKKSAHITLVLAEPEKFKEPRFKIVKPERIKKREIEKIRKERAQQREQSGFARSREASEEIYGEAKSREARKEKETKKTKGPGFIKRIFRRKSI
jgi:large subunit ribosomal protein L22